MADEVMGAYVDKYGQPPNHPNHLLQFSKSRRDLPTLNYSSSRQALSNWERAKRKKKKKKDKKKLKKKKDKQLPSLQSSKSTPPEARTQIQNNAPKSGWIANPEPDKRSPASYNQSPITINHSSSPHSVTPEPHYNQQQHEDEDNDDYKQHSYDEPEITEMNDEEDNNNNNNYNQHRHRTIVIDNGTSLMKVGYVGDQAPIAQYHPTQISKKRNLQKNPISRGIITDTNMIEAVYSNTFTNVLNLDRDDLSDYGVILNCAVFCPQDTAEQLCEIMMEGFGFSKFYICSSALLSLYGTQKVSGLVIESGASLTQCVPIWNGCPVAQACKRVDVGGDDVDEYLRDLLRSTHKNLAENDLTNAICKKIKEQHGYIALNYRKEKSKRIEYQLPNGKTIKIGDERFKCGELLFSYLDRNSIDKQIYDSVMSCDADIRKEMLSNIVISGGSTLFRGIASRIKMDLIESCKTSKTKKMKKYSKKVNILSPANRDVLSWCGGSIFGALPAFEQFWFTMEDYQEKGAILSQKIEHSNIFFYDDYQPKELDLQEIQNYNAQYRRRTLSVYTYTGSVATPQLQTGSGSLLGGDNNIFPENKKQKSNPFPHIAPGFGAENPFHSARNVLQPKGSRGPPKKAPPKVPIRDIQQPKRTLGPIRMQADAAAASAAAADDEDVVKTYSEPWNDEPDEEWDPTKMDAIIDRPRERSRAVNDNEAQQPQKVQLSNLQAYTPEVDPETPEPKSFNDPSNAMAAAVADNNSNNNNTEMKLRQRIGELQNLYDEVLLQVEELKLENDMLEKQNDALLQENKLLKHKGKRFDNESRTVQNAKAKVEKEKNDIIANTAQIAREISNIQQMFINGTNRLQRINFDYLFDPTKVEEVTD